MTTWRIVLVGLAMLVLLFHVGCSEESKERYHFRMTVEVETPQGLRTGSSVYEVSAWRPVIRDAIDRAWSVRGEAVAVDLPGGKTLFALLKTNAMHNDMAGLSMTALDPAFNNDIIESATRIAARRGIRSPAEVPRSDYPMLVTFRDPKDPKSVERVTSDDLSATFGVGVKLKRITVRVANDAVTTGIEKRLAWLETHIGSLVKRERNRPIGDMPEEHRLTVTNFKMGTPK